MQGLILLIFSATALLCASAQAVSSSASTTSVSGIEVGFDTYLPPDYGEPRPYVTTNYNTTNVSQHKVYEAVLRCFDQSPVYRAVNCDLLTWDSCNNVYGGPEVAKQWTVVVEALQEDRNTIGANTGAGAAGPAGAAGAGSPASPSSGGAAAGAGGSSASNEPEKSRLVSPLFHLKTGVTRFYFTPVVIGPYKVTITRNTTEQPTVMYTNTTLSQFVIVHDVVAVCTHRYFGEMIRQFQDVLWAEEEWLNERQRFPGEETYSVPNTILADRYDIYSPKAALLQDEVRRRPIEQYVKLDRVERLPPEDNRQHYCDMIPRVN